MGYEMCDMRSELDDRRCVEWGSAKLIKILSFIKAVEKSHKS
jgi:hypothetical protein